MLNYDTNTQLISQNSHSSPTREWLLARIQQACLNEWPWNSFDWIRVTLVCARPYCTFRKLTVCKLLYNCSYFRNGLFVTSICWNDNLAAGQASYIWFTHSLTIPWSRRSLGHHSRRRGQLGPSMSVLGQSHGFYGAQPGPFGDVVFPSSSLSASPSGSFYCPLQYGFRQSCWPHHVVTDIHLSIYDYDIKLETTKIKQAFDKVWYWKLG